MNQILLITNFMAGKYTRHSPHAALKTIIQNQSLKSDFFEEKRETEDPPVQELRNMVLDNLEDSAHQEATYLDNDESSFIMSKNQIEMMDRNGQQWFQSLRRSDKLGRGDKEAQTVFGLIDSHLGGSYEEKNECFSEMKSLTMVNHCLKNVIFLL
jgi:hypothetical protein